MAREISAGGVVIRKREGVWWMAAIEPPTETARAAVRTKLGRPKVGHSKAGRSRDFTEKRGPKLTLPKGLVDPGEKALEAAIREVREETGLTAEPVTKLADIKYIYTRVWGDGQRVFKIVSFYLMRYRSGRIDQLTPEMRIEVARARWVRLDKAPALLAYKGEKQMARRAVEYVAAHPEL
jgi:8-oxo-dGTP pyrophosphatase MutT (NUDIX family)